MKTKDLTGAALDWAVARCEGYSEWDGECFTSYADGYPGAFYLDDWKPSSKWADGGVIIERELISLDVATTDYDEDKGGLVLLPKPVWYAVKENGDDEETLARGETPLIAAMRCYVASKLGTEIDTPKELK